MMILNGYSKTMISLIKQILIIVFFSNIFPDSNNQLNETVKYILDGHYIYKNKYINNDNNDSYYYKKINSILNENDSRNNFLKGIIESDGDISKSHFLNFYENHPSDLYADLSVVKIADYYYSKGIYLEASNWYKKIPIDYPDSKYVEKSISYYLNSLLVSGYKDTADYYIVKFKKDFPKLQFSDEYVPNKISKKNNVVKNNKNHLIEKKYSVQIGAFKNYSLAKSKKNILSKEGFLCRIDELLIRGEVFYSVRTGTFKSEKLAVKEQMRLISRIGIYDSIVIEVD